MPLEIIYAVQYVLQLELLHDGKGAADNEHYFKHFAAHLGMDGHLRSGGVSCTIGHQMHGVHLDLEVERLQQCRQMHGSTQPG